MAFSRTTLALAVVLVLIGSALAQGPASAPVADSPAPVLAPLSSPPAADVLPPVTAEGPGTTTTPAPESPPVSDGVAPTTDSTTAHVHATAPAPAGEKSGAFVHGSNWVAVAAFGGIVALFA